MNRFQYIPAAITDKINTDVGEKAVMVYRIIYSNW